MTTASSRRTLLERLRMDLVGPYQADEVISERPSDRYLSGILFPQRTQLNPEEDEQLSGAGESESTTGDTADESVPLIAGLKPASAGLSFVVERNGGGDWPEINIRVRCGTYEGIEERDENTGRTRVTKWRRSGHDFVVGPVRLDFGNSFREKQLQEYGLPGGRLYIRTALSGRKVTCTTVLINDRDAGESRPESEMATFFQAGIEITTVKGSRFVPRPVRSGGVDEDSLCNDLIYRGTREFAVGHTSSASWECDDDGEPVSISTTWIPDAKVSAVSPDGAPEFGGLSRTPGLDPLSAEWLSGADPASLSRAMKLLCDCYGDWISSQEKKVGAVGTDLRAQAAQNLDVCKSALERMNRGADLISRDENVRKSFQLANRAMELQVAWQKDEKNKHLRWRPFQLAFQLLVVESLAIRDGRDRSVMDLLWFPTGGGKTEAYLGLIAFTLFYRRISSRKNPDRGAGVNVFMRYTLRLLTVQQFQRAAALICACEHLRATEGERYGLGKTRFSIGLWVGGAATPNNVSDAHEAAESPEASSSPKQLKTCPACRSDKLRWGITGDNSRFPVFCLNDECIFGKTKTNLPVWTVDTDIYRECPSLVIGTIDKFAQIVRKPDTGRLFGVNTQFDPPEMIIQDELHLISGPLGTIAGIYEVAVDELCSRAGFRPKLIGSTATIRRAKEQIRSLFNRDAFQFPPPGLDAGNSGFAVTDGINPGRLYVGVTTAGRSPKYTLQAVCASLLQAVTDKQVPDDRRDDYWTLVAYFNSLRELGGARVMMLDDVPSTIKTLSKRRSEKERMLAPPEELTSAKRQSEIPDMLESLKLKHDQGDAVDILLASNMISVGVDIPRLALMVVNGQPKGMAEYIQATSRVGRSAIPGLVIAVYNNSKARDRSHYETFPTWHSALYREVEATSVTPFASRARDKALHAALVAMARYLVDGLTERPALSLEQRRKCEELASRISRRASEVDASEAAGVESDLRRLIDEWYGRDDLRKYWDDSPRGHSLLMSAEQVAAIKEAEWGLRRVWSTPNSMREVEPSTQFVVARALRRKGPEVKDGE